MKSPYPKSVYAHNSTIYKILANPIRLEILNTIKNKEASVEALTKMLGIRKANVSQHLSLLRHARLVHIRKNGVRVYYRITNPKLVEPCRILKNLWSK